MVRILVILHESSCPLGRFADVWAEAGVGVQQVEAWTAPVPPCVDADALVVMGGEMGCRDDAIAPWLAPTRRLIARSIDAGVPFLGVCLGHQLATVALGGDVATSQHLSLGVSNIDPTEAGTTDPFLSRCLPGRGIHYNNDAVVALPEGAELLATGPHGQIEAVRFAPRAWGLQFHPECTADVFDAWTVGHGEEEWTGRLPRADAVTAAQQVRRDERAEATGRAVATAFLDVLGSRRASSP